MAKKERNQDVELSIEPIEQPVESEPLFEAEAYGSPQPEKGSDVTVMKPVGIGGPVPIVAPKHNTIQLQPIVVPLAVVPYMTQDSGVLRTDGRQQGGYGADMDEYVESTQFESVAQEKKKKKHRHLLPRIFALITCLIAAVVMVPFLIYDKSGGDSLGLAAMNIIDIIKGWVSDGFSWSPATNLLYIIIACVAAVQTVLALIGLIIGKYPKPINPIFAFIDMGCLIGVLVVSIVGKSFVASEQVGFLIVLSASILGFLTSTVFTVILNRKEDADEQNFKRKNEI